MGQVLGDDAPGVCKRQLSQIEGDTVLLLVLVIFPFVPVKARHRHLVIVTQSGKQAIPITICVYGPRAVRWRLNPAPGAGQSQPRLVRMTTGPPGRGS